MGKKFARKVHDVPINCLSIGTSAGLFWRSGVFVHSAVT